MLSPQAVSQVYVPWLRASLEGLFLFLADSVAKPPKFDVSEVAATRLVLSRVLG